MKFMEERVMGKGEASLFPWKIRDKEGLATRMKGVLSFLAGINLVS
jgi:hypothetical protein